MNLMKILRTNAMIMEGKRTLIERADLATQELITD